MSTASQNKQTGSRKARATAARLTAVQAVYQIDTNQQSASSVIQEYKLHRFGEVIDDAELVTPDGVLFETVVTGVYENLNKLEQMISVTMSKEVQALEPLLRSILLCGSYELLANLDVDAPVIISDYINVTHAFFDQGENKLINGILDNIKKSVRDVPL